jgi:hypothetical protein
MATLRKQTIDRPNKKQKKEIETLTSQLFNSIESISNQEIYIWKDGDGYWNYLMTLIGQNLRYRQIEIIFQNGFIRLKYYRILNGYQEERGFINFSDIRSSEIKEENGIYILYINAYNREYSFWLQSPQLGYQINNIIQLYLVIYQMHKNTNSKIVCNLLFYQYEKEKFINKVEGLEQFLYTK